MSVEKPLPVISDSSRRVDSVLTNINLRTLFVSAFLLGLLPIVATAATNTLWVVMVFGVVLPLLFLIGYWAVGQFSGQAIEQQESFADSVYYLGFLLTLASLLAALFSLRGVRPDLGMLAARFGLALTTTIFGLLIRVTIVNFERDLDDEERRARESLTRGVDGFQAEVERLSDQLQLVLSEMAQRTRELGSETVSVAKEQLAELSRQSEETHKDFTAANSRIILESTTRLNEAVTLTHDSLLSSFRDSNSAMRAANSQLISESSKKMNESVVTMHDSLLATLGEVNSSIKAASQGTTAVFSALQETPRAYQERTEQNIKSLEEAQNNLSEIISAQSAIAKDIAEQSTTASHITQKLNVAAADSAAQLQQFTVAGQQAEDATRKVAACLQNLDGLGQSLRRFEEVVKQGPLELEVMLPKLRLAMEEIAELSRGGESSLRQVQQNLIGATEEIVNHLGKK